MATRTQLGDYQLSRSDVFMVDPRALSVDWKKNLSRNGEEIQVDDELISFAKSLMPRNGGGAAEDGSSGQINPITVRPVPGDRSALEVVGGFRRMRAGLWLIESGTCPDFKIKYCVSRMSDLEAMLANLDENMQRDDPKPVQLAHAIRRLTEDYGMTITQVSGRLKKTASYLNYLLDLVMLPEVIQESVDAGKTPIAAAIELGKLPTDEQVPAFKEITKDGTKATVARVQKKREEVREKTGQGDPIKKGLKQIKDFLEGKTGPEEYGKNFASYLLDWIDGTRTDDQLEKYWNTTFRSL
jgi:ParB/RepB/Spo0J family partition protein